MCTFSPMRRNASLLPILLVSVLTLVGCTDDGPGPPAPSTQSTPASPTRGTPTALPLPTPVAPTSGAEQDVTQPPARPDALDGPGTKENAAAVAKYFIKLFPYAVATGDLTEWSALSGDACGYCHEARDIVDGIRQAGNHGVGGALDISGSETYLNDDGSYVVILGLTQHPSQTVDADGVLVEDFPSTNRYRPLVELAFEGSWTVTGVQMDKAP